jgi:hypothetical protein
MVRLPDRAHGVVHVLADGARLSAVAGCERPESGSEVGPAEDAIRGEADEHQNERDFSQTHARART